jgi:alkylated DNA repair dioxygenase AlkB
MRQADIRTFMTGCGKRTVVPAASPADGPAAVPAPAPAPARHQLDADCWIDQGRVPAALVPAPGEAFDALWRLHPDERGSVRMFDRLIATPRWHQSYIRSYRFSGVDHVGLPLPPVLEPLLAWARDATGTAFNQVLVNWYADGAHYIGPHSDDERDIVRGSPIMSISFGQTRGFRVRRKDDSSVALDLDMPDGSYLIMGGQAQRHFTHEVPKVSGERGAAMGRRINVTMRSFGSHVVLDRTRLDAACSQN